MFETQLKMLRQQHNLTQQQLAADLGVSPSTIGNYEQGIRRPGILFVSKIAAYFNVSSDYLMRGPAPAELEDLFAHMALELRENHHLTYRGKELDAATRRKLCDAMRIGMQVALEL